MLALVKNGRYFGKRKWLLFYVFEVLSCSDSSSVQTKLEAVLAVLVAAFLGFGVAMTSNALLLEYFHWKQKRARRAQLSATPSTMDVEPSFRTQEMSGELTGNNSQWSRELATSSSPDLEMGSEPATVRGSPSARSQAASESHHSMHCS